MRLWGGWDCGMGREDCGKGGWYSMVGLWGGSEDGRMVLLWWDCGEDGIAEYTILYCSTL